MADNARLPPDGEIRSLAHSINSAIASSHTKINRLVLDRMPHAVPPQADNPSAYITGLLHIGAVYIAFESLWQNIIGVHTEIAPLPYLYPFHNNDNNTTNTTNTTGPGPGPGHGHGSTPPQVTERARRMLETAYWPNMLRAARVKADVCAMTGWPTHVVDEQIRSAGTTGALGGFLAHIKEAVDQSPHLLLAYAYSLYLALLSGGSYIRTELMYLRAYFWLAIPDPVRPGMIPCTREPAVEPDKPRRRSTFEGCSGLAMEDLSVTLPLSFLDFDTPLGHENPRQQAKDLKAEFKRRFSEAERALTDSERREIVAESVAIFNHLEAVVGQLDKICSSGAGPARQARSSHHSMRDADSQPAGIGSRLRDSIAVARGRLLRTMKRSSVTGASAVTANTPSAARSTVMSVSTTAGPPGFSEGSKGSFVSSGWPGTSAHGYEADAPLARYATLPGEGFRTVHYSDDNAHPDTGAKAARRGAGGYDGAADDGDNDRQSSIGRISQVCPIFRGPTLLAGEKRPGTSSTSEVRGGMERALHDYCVRCALVSNMVVLLGACAVFSVYLYVRRCDGATSATTGIDW